MSDVLEEIEPSLAGGVEVASAGGKAR